MEEILDGFGRDFDDHKVAITFADPDAPDVPIVFANQAFQDLTGYEKVDLVGKNCRFLQGPGTNPDAVASIRKMLTDRQAGEVLLLNYKADGTPFHNALYLDFIRAERTKTLIAGCQYEIPASLFHSLSAQSDRIRYSAHSRIDQVVRNTRMMMKETLRQRSGSTFAVIRARSYVRYVDSQGLVAKHT